MDFAATHVLLVDYDQGNRRRLIEAFDDEQATIHECRSRWEAAGMLMDLLREGILPRGVLANWLLDDPQRRAFYREVGREVDHTSMSLFRDAAAADRENRTIMVCYTHLYEEALSELTAEQLDTKVAVANLGTMDLGMVAKMLMQDERTRIVRTLNDISSGAYQTKELIQQSSSSSSDYDSSHRIRKRLSR